jgi:hypothetical protein
MRGLTPFQEESMLRLTTDETRVLKNQPETGMGYQLVEGTQFDDKKKVGIAYNAELFFEEGESRSVLRTLSYPKVLDLATKSTGQFKSLRVLSRSAAPISLSERRLAAAKAAPAKDGKVEQTKENEVFKRFSAYENDNRLQADGSWSDGTYATTEEDAKNVKTGKDAVGRYALPNPEPACYVFTAKPKKDTDIQKGIVEPAFGQPGDGVEVIFPKGTQANTVTGPTQIPKE